MIFDSHCHLDSRSYGGDAGVDEVIATARAAGVSRMLTVGAGYGDGSAQRAVEVARRHPGVWASVGIHPHDARTLTDEVLAALRALTTDPKVRAWGEIGLDFFYDLSEREVQRAAFRRQIRTALELRLPIIIHDRDSAGETLDILREEQAFDGAGVLYHCYAGDVDAMREIVSLGGLISIPGTLTFRRSETTREVARLAPLHALLVETDAPFLTPEPLRGRRNEPCHIALTVDALAELRGMDRGELCAVTTENACRFFQVP